MFIFRAEKLKIQLGYHIVHLLLFIDHNHTMIKTVNSWQLSMKLAVIECYVVHYRNALLLPLFLRLLNKNNFTTSVTEVK